MSTLEVGRVTKPHGIRGEVKVQLHFASSTALFEVDRVLLRWDDHEQWYEVDSAGAGGKHVVLALAGVGDRNAAEGLRGAAVLVERDALPQLADGEFYLADLVGATVAAGDTLVGQVVEVRTHPSVDSLIIRTPEDKLVEQALAEPWLLSVDVEGRRIELSSTDGLIL